MPIHIDLVDKVLIAIFIALLIMAYYCYSAAPQGPARVASATSNLVA